MLEHGFTKSEAVVEVHPLKTPPGGEDVSACSCVHQSSNVPRSRYVLYTIPGMLERALGPSVSMYLREQRRQSIEFC